ncbi:MAG: hypothetical protein VB977_06075, partial [Pseudohongiellaceae bacterium]
MKMLIPNFVLAVFWVSCAPNSDDLSPTGTAGEWRHHGGDHASSKYADLDQIDASNFDQLEVA